MSNYDPTWNRWRTSPLRAVQLFCRQVIDKLTGPEVLFIAKVNAKNCERSIVHSDERRNAFRVGHAFSQLSSLTRCHHCRVSRYVLSSFPSAGWTRARCAGDSSHRARNWRDIVCRKLSGTVHGSIKPRRRKRKVKCTHVARSALFPRCPHAGTGNAKKVQQRWLDDPTIPITALY